MTFKNFKQEFKNALITNYPQSEIASFFNLLLEHITGLSRLDLAINPEKELNLEQENQFNQALIRLKKHEPVQYIIGETDFYGLTFKVDKNVLIPRPETEELVRWVLENLPSGKDTSILDIGTGSGCIPISLKKKSPQTSVTAFDISESALEIATKNATLNQVEVNFQKVDILSSPLIDNKYDIIISNPPYVRDLEKSEMNKNVLEYEPHLALFVTNNDALLFYRHIINFAQSHLKPTGNIYFEINQYLKEDLTQLLTSKGITDFTFKKDIFGHWRMLKIHL